MLLGERKRRNINGVISLSKYQCKALQFWNNAHYMYLPWFQAFCSQYISNTLAQLTAYVYHGRMAINCNN